VGALTADRKAFSMSDALETADFDLALDISLHISA
jgi:hypothetical protein